MTIKSKAENKPVISDFSFAYAFVGTQCGDAGLRLVDLYRGSMEEAISYSSQAAKSWAKVNKMCNQGDASSVENMEAIEKEVSFAMFLSNHADEHFECADAHKEAIVKMKNDAMQS